jgi:3-oxoacyl-[acyl-carrier-protein] synthase II
MIARSDTQRIAITGVGLTAPGANSLRDFRANLLAGRSGVRDYDIRYVGKTVAGVCDFDELRHQKKKEVRRGTRAASPSTATWKPKTRFFN